MLREVSAGIVPFVLHNNAIQVLLLKYSRFFGFPKGRIEKGETLKQTAIRELGEETGLHIKLISDDVISSIDYQYSLDGEPVNKTVHYFAAIVDYTDVKLSKEHEGFLLIPSEEVLASLSFENTREVYKAAFIWFVNQIITNHDG